MKTNLVKRLSALLVGSAVALGLGALVSLPKEAKVSNAEGESCVTFTVKDWGGLSASSYVSDFCEGNGVLDDNTTIRASMKQFIPSSGQIKGNQTSATNQFMLYNIDEIPGSISSITVSGDISSSNYFKNKLYCSVGTGSQENVNDVIDLVSWDLDTLTFTFDSSDGYTYFKLLSNEKFTNGSVKEVEIKVYFEPAGLSSYGINFAQTFNNSITCDSTGATKPTFSTNNWSNLADLYGSLSSNDKNIFNHLTADTFGNDAEKAVAKYDYIVGKYFMTGLDTSFYDFMNRAPAPLSSSTNIKNIINNSSTVIWVILGAAVIGIGTIEICLINRKKKAHK